MNPLEAVERLIELVRANGDIANHADGCDLATLEAAESLLGVALPPSYRRLVEEFGTWDIAGQEFLGLYRTTAAGDTILGTCVETLDARRDYGLPENLIVAMFDNMGGLIVLDSSSPLDGGEYPVRVWNPGVANPAGMETLAQDFGNFAFGLCRRAVDVWRETT
jgi:hypothetical protein